MILRLKLAIDNIYKQKGIKVKQQNFILIISSPSGTGKTSISKRIISDDPNIKLSISVTTRPKRSSEEEGIDYYFVDQAQFEKMRAQDEFLEYAKVFGNYYGSPKQNVIDQLSKGNEVLFDIDWQGALALKEKLGRLVVSIFILPPSLAEQERRLKLRGQDSDEVVANRMEESKFEMSHYNLYDYVLINKDFDKTLSRIKAIIKAERLKHMDFSKFVEEMIVSKL